MEVVVVLAGERAGSGLQGINIACDTRSVGRSERRSDAGFGHHAENCKGWETVDSSLQSAGTGLEREINHQDGDDERKVETGAKRMGTGRDDADKPRERAAAETRRAKKESTDPVGVIAENCREPGDENRILRGQAETGDGGAEVQCVGRIRKRNDDAAYRGQGKSPDGDGDLSQVAKRKRSHTAAEQ